MKLNRVIKNKLTCTLTIVCCLFATSIYSEQCKKVAREDLTPACTNYPQTYECTSEEVSVVCLVSNVVCTQTDWRKITVNDTGKNCTTGGPSDCCKVVDWPCYTIESGTCVTTVKGHVDCQAYSGDTHTCVQTRIGGPEETGNGTASMSCSQ